jgi:hypothetical protein
MIPQDDAANGEDSTGSVTLQSGTQYWLVAMGGRARYPGLLAGEHSGPRGRSARNSVIGQAPADDPFLGYS